MKPRIYGCGTRAGYNYHRRYNTDPCDACREANRDYIRRLSQRRRRAVAELYEDWPTTILPPSDNDYWRNAGNCANPQLDVNFHSDNPAEIRLAIAICRGCQVIDQCAQEQHQLKAPGVWAGVRWVEAAFQKQRIKPDPRYLLERPVG